MSEQLFLTDRRVQVSLDGVIQIIRPPSGALSKSRQSNERILDICSLLADHIADDRDAHRELMVSAARAILRVERSRTISLTAGAISLVLLLLIPVRFRRRPRIRIE